MLRKPGEVDRSGSGRALASSRRKVQESPDDIVRQLQRLAGNKKCADCSAKLPQAANLTHGTFVCSTCSGIHREFNHRIKGIGHSSFTAEESEFLGQNGNEAVNAKYLGKLNPSDKLRQPDASVSPVDGQMLRVYLRRKYTDKLWFSDDSPSSQPPPPSTTAEVKPTMAAIPPKAADPPPDLFGGDIFLNASTTTTTNNGGGNFGFQADFSSMNHPTNFEANFDQMVPPPSTPNSFMSNTQQVPDQFNFQANFPTNQASPTHSQPAFAADFPNQHIIMTGPQPFSVNVQQQQTPGVHSHNNFHQQVQQSHSQQPGASIVQSNINFHPQYQQQQTNSNLIQTPHNFHQQSNVTQSQNNFHQQFQQHPQQQFNMQNVSPQQNLYANPISSINYQQHLNNQQSMNYGMNPSQSNNYGNFQQTQQSLSPQSAGKSNLQSTFQQQYPPHQNFHVNVHQSNPEVLNNVPIQSPLSFESHGKQIDFSQANHQLHPSNTQFLQPSLNINTVSENNTSFQSSKDSTPGVQTVPNIGFTQKFESLNVSDSPVVGDQEKKSVMGANLQSNDAFGAFDNISMEGNGRVNTVTTPKPSDGTNKIRFTRGDSVVYRESDYCFIDATIVDTHLDDALVPFYTIKLPNGRDKQTVDSRLFTFELKEILNSLLKIDSEKFNVVSSFLKELSSGNGISSSANVNIGIQSNGDNLNSFSVIPNNGVSLSLDNGMQVMPVPVPVPSMPPPPPPPEMEKHGNPFDL